MVHIVQDDAVYGGGSSWVYYVRICIYNLLPGVPELGLSSQDLLRTRCTMIDFPECIIDILQERFTADGYLHKVGQRGFLA